MALKGKKNAIETRRNHYGNEYDSVCALFVVYFLCSCTHTQKKRVNVRQIDDVSAWKTIKH